MTLQQLFTLTTMEHRHLLVAYTLVAVVQLGYLFRTLRGLFRSTIDAGVLDVRPPAASSRS